MDAFKYDLSIRGLGSDLLVPAPFPYALDLRTPVEDFRSVAAMLGRPILGRFVPMLGRELPSVDLPPPPAAETLSLEGLDEAATIDVCLVGAMDAREEEPDTRELRDALDTAASVVRLRDAMLSSSVRVALIQIPNTRSYPLSVDNVSVASSFFELRPRTTVTCSLPILPAELQVTASAFVCNATALYPFSLSTRYAGAVLALSPLTQK